MASMEIPHYWIVELRSAMRHRLQMELDTNLDSVSGSFDASTRLVITVAAAGSEIDDRSRPSILLANSEQFPDFG